MLEDKPSFDNCGDMIRFIRKQKRISIIELAEKIGVTSSYIAGIEQGDIKPTKEQIEVIQMFL